MKCPELVLHSQALTYNWTCAYNDPNLCYGGKKTWHTRVESRSNCEWNRRNDCSHSRVGARRRRVHCEHRVWRGEPVTHGNVHHDPCLQNSEREADHCSVTFVPVCATRQEGQKPCTDYGKAGCEYASEKRLRPRHSAYTTLK